MYLGFLFCIFIWNVILFFACHFYNVIFLALLFCFIFGFIDLLIYFYYYYFVNL